MPVWVVAVAVSSVFSRKNQRESARCLQIVRLILWNYKKEKVKSLANETAGIIGLTLKFKAREVEIYKNGKLIETARYDGDKLVYTGNNVNAVLVVSSVVVIALVAGFALRKKFANA